MRASGCEHIARYHLFCGPYRPALMPCRTPSGSTVTIWVSAAKAYAAASRQIEFADELPGADGWPFSLRFIPPLHWRMLGGPELPPGGGPVRARISIVAARGGPPERRWLLRLLDESARNAGGATR